MYNRRKVADTRRSSATPCVLGIYTCTSINGKPQHVACMSSSSGLPSCVCAYEVFTLCLQVSLSFALISCGVDGLRIYVCVYYASFALMHIVRVTFA